MIYYYNDCTTCKNVSLAICRETALRAGVLKKKYPQYDFPTIPTVLDERYVGALSVWREEAEALMSKALEKGSPVSLPFLYNEETNEILPLPEKIDKNDTTVLNLWKAEVANFWGSLVVAECEDNPNCQNSHTLNKQETNKK